jgi:hypothetical protein
MNVFTMKPVPEHEKYYFSQSQIFTYYNTCYTKVIAIFLLIITIITACLKVTSARNYFNIYQD